MSTQIYTFFVCLGRYSQWVLIAGLVVGILWEDAANFIRGYLAELIFFLLALSAFRIGLNALLSLKKTETLGSTVIVVIYQLALPSCLMGFAILTGLMDHPMMLALILMSSAPSVTATPALAIILKEDPAPPLRLLLIGTAIMPLTALPPLLFLGFADNLTEASLLVGQLALIIFGACLLGLTIRQRMGSHFSSSHVPAVDGGTSILLAVIVVGLMSALGPTLKTAPLDVLLWLLFAIVVNFGLQAIGYLFIGKSAMKEHARALCLVAGNRNIALFLTILPEEIMAPLMIFIACYQIPMYLTPVFHKCWIRLATGMNKPG